MKSNDTIESLATFGLSLVSGTNTQDAGLKDLVGALGGLGKDVLPQYLGNLGTLTQNPIAFLANAPQYIEMTGIALDGLNKDVIPKITESINELSSSVKKGNALGIMNASINSITNIGDGVVKFAEDTVKNNPLLITTTLPYLMQLATVTAPIIGQIA